MIKPLLRILGRDHRQKQCADGTKGPSKMRERGVLQKALTDPLRQYIVALEIFKKTDC
jgi:hypothetical protein